MRCQPGWYFQCHLGQALFSALTWMDEAVWATSDPVFGSGQTGPPEAGLLGSDLGVLCAGVEREVKQAVSRPLLRTQACRPRLKESLEQTNRLLECFVATWSQL